MSLEYSSFHLTFSLVQLLTVDDRTGVVFEIVGSELVPRFILADGDGHASKGGGVNAFCRLDGPWGAHLNL